MATGQQGVRRKVGLTAQLNDAPCNQVSVGRFLIGMHHELRCNGGRRHSMSGKVVALVAQHAHQLGCQGIVEQAHDVIAMLAESWRDSPLVEVARARGLEGLLVERHARGMWG